MTDDGPPWQDRETLRRLFYDEGLTKAQIAEQLGSTSDAVTVWMKHHGLEPSGASQSGPPGDIDVRELLEMEPEEVIRRHRDRALELADRHRERGETAMADEIERRVEAAVGGST